VTAYDSPIYIADAAVYLKATRPDLKITNPYELDSKQFQAAVDLLKKQRQSIGQYWADYTKEQAAFASGDSTVGTTWQVIANLLEGDKIPVRTVLPKEGSTGWSDTWMLASKAQHPNCAYKWMNWIISPKVNAQVAEWFGEAPANQKACAMTADKNHCKTFHAGDDAYFKHVSFWTTPRATCGDSRGSVCADYAKWVQAWTEIKG
jgi:putative spermidine/putrescine transport system substrate-binding protein